MPRRVTLTAACLAVLAAPPAAHALSVAVATPDPLRLAPGTVATTKLRVLVSSSLPYALTLHDSSSRTPGFLDPVDCAGGGLLDGSSLRAPLQWASRVAGRSGTLDAAPSIVTAGLPLRRVEIDVLQDVAAARELGSGACFQAPVTITVS